MIGSTVGHYRITEQLGQGGMGVVFRADDLRLGRTVALKFLPPHLSLDRSAKERFMTEARTASALEHPNVCAVHDIDETDDGRLYMVMPFYEGQTLKQRLAHGSMGLQEALDLGRQIAKGLVQAHGAGIVHRDLKPANIMLLGSGRAVILDFGVAKPAEGIDLTREGSTVGTAAYMSPEQARGERVDARSDLWSLGVLLYEMIEGTQPFEGTYEAAVAYSIINQPHAPMTAAQDRIRDIVDGLLSKSAGDRPDSARAVELALEASAAMPKATAQPEDPAGFAPGRLALSPGRIGIVAVVLLCVAALVYWNTREDATASESGRPSIAVLYIENITDEDRLGSTVADMLSRNLARGEALEVASSQRFVPILRSMGREESSLVDAGVAADIAREAGVQTMLVGSIVQLGDRIRLDAELTDVQSLRIITSVTDEVPVIDELFAMVDRIALKIERALGSGGSEQEITLSAVSTSSIASYRAAERGFYHENRWEFDLAEEAYREAIALDDEYADAHLGLARVLDFPGDGPWQDYTEARSHVIRARELSESIPGLEGDAIRARVDLMLGGNGDEEVFRRALQARPDDPILWQSLLRVISRPGNRPEEAKRIYQRILELDPENGVVYNWMAYLAVQRGLHDEAQNQVRMYVAVHDDVPNAYDSAWEVALWRQDLEEASRVAAAALERDPPFPWGYIMRSRVRGLARDTTGALEDVSTYAQRARFPAIVAPSREFQLRLLWGQRARAIGALERAVEGERAKGVTIDYLWKAGMLGSALYNAGRGEEADRLFRRAIDRSGAAYEGDFNPTAALVTYRAALHFAEVGDLEEGASRTRELEALMVDSLLDRRHRYYMGIVRTEMAIQNRQFGEAANHLASLPLWWRTMLPQVPWLRARILAANDSVDVAVGLLRAERFSVMRSRNFIGDPYTWFSALNLVEYRAGLLYEAAGRREEAIEAFQNALSRWAYFDSDVDEREDARLRLARMQRTSG